MEDDGAQQDLDASQGYLKAKQDIKEQLKAKQLKVAASFKRQVVRNGGIVLEDQVDKYLQLEEALWIRNGIIIAGPPQSGKSSLWKLSLDETNEYVVVDTEYQSMEELFGYYDDNAIFVEGFVPKTIRHYMSLDFQSSSANRTTSGLKFIVFTGKMSEQL